MYTWQYKAHAELADWIRTAWIDKIAKTIQRKFS